MFVMLNNSVEDSCVCLICVACIFLDFFRIHFFLSILSILLYFFPGRTCRCATSFEFFVIMYVYIIRKIIVTIVKFNFNTKD